MATEISNENTVKGKYILNDINYLASENKEVMNI